MRYCKWWFVRLRLLQIHSVPYIKNIVTGGAYI